MKMPSMIEGFFRRIGLSAGDVEYKSDRSKQLEELLRQQEHRTIAAVNAFNQTASDLQMQGIETAQHLTEARRAVMGVTQRLAHVHAEPDMLSDGRRRSPQGRATDDLD